MRVRESPRSRTTRCTCSRATPAALATANATDALHLPTRDPGGQVFRNSNELGGDFARMLKSHEVTYVLGFSGAAKTPGKFHNLKVKVVNVPGARLSHRPGYYEPAPITSDFDRFLTAGEI